MKTENFHTWKINRRMKKFKWKVTENISFDYKIFFGRNHFWCRYLRTFSHLRKNPLFLSVTALKVPGETTKGLHLALFLFLEPRKNIGKSLKKEKNSTISKSQRGTQITTQIMNSSKKKILVAQKYVCDLC